MKTSYVLNDGIKTNLTDFTKNEKGEIVLQPDVYSNMVIDSSLTLDRESMNLFSYDNDGDENDLSLNFTDDDGNIFTIVLKDITNALATNPTEAPVYSLFDMNTNNELISFATLDDLEAAAAGGENASDSSRFNQINDQINQFIENNDLARADLPGQGTTNSPENPLFARNITFAGDLSFEITEDYGQALEYDGIEPDNGIEIYSGTITNSDPHFPPLPFIANTIVSEYGIFTILENGNWVFAFDYTNPEIQALDAGDVVSDIFTVQVAGEFASFDIILTLNGLNDQPEVEDVMIGMPDIYDDNQIFDGDSITTSVVNGADLIYESSLENFNQNEDSKFNNSDFEVANLSGFDIDEDSSLTYYIAPSTTTVVDTSNTVVDIQPSDIVIVVDEITGAFSVYSEKLNNLAFGESVKISFDYVADDGLGFTGDTGLDDVTDENSVSEPATVTLMVTGTNDKPYVTDDCNRSLSIGEDNYTPVGVVMTALNAHGGTQPVDITPDGLGVRTHHHGDYDIQEGGLFHHHEGIKFEYDDIYTQAAISLSRFGGHDKATWTLYLDGIEVDSGTTTDADFTLSGTAFDTLVIKAAFDGKLFDESDFRIKSIDVDYLTTKENTALTIDVLDNDYDDDTADSLVIYDHDYTPEGDSSVSIINNKLEFDPGTDFDYLALGESTQVIFQYRVDDQRGFGESGNSIHEASISEWATVKILVVGTNDRPVAVDDLSKSVSIGEDNYTPTGVTMTALNAHGGTQPVDITPDGLGVRTHHHGDYDIQEGGLFHHHEGIKFEYDDIYTQAAISLSRFGGHDKATWTLYLDGIEVDSGTTTDADFTLSGTAFDTLVIKAAFDGKLFDESDFRIKSIDVDYLTTEENTSLTIDVLANDYDLDVTDVISINNYDTTTSHGGTVSEVGGKLVFDPGTDFDYLADGEEQLVTFTYDVKDDSGASNDTSAPALVTILVKGTNDRPIAIDDSEDPVLLDTTLFDVQNTTGMSVWAYYNGNENNTASTPVVNGAWGVQNTGGEDPYIDGAYRNDTIVFEFDNSFEKATVSLKSIHHSETAYWQAYNDNGDLIANGSTNQSSFDILASGIAEIRITAYGHHDDFLVKEIETFSPMMLMTEENTSLTIDVLANDYDLDVTDVISINNYDTTTSHGGTVSEVGGKLVFDPGTDFDYLADGEEQVVTFTYDVKDDSGASNDTSAPALVTILVKGTNDRPVAIDDNKDPVQLETTLFDVQNTTGMSVWAYYNGNENYTAATPVVNGAWGVQNSGGDSSQIDGAYRNDTIVFEFDNSFEKATVTLKYINSSETAHWQAFNDNGDLIANGSTNQSSFDILSSGIAEIRITAYGHHDDFLVEEIETFSPMMLMTEENTSLTIDVLANDYDLDVTDVISINNYDTTTSHGGTVSEVGGKLVFDPGTDFDYLADGEEQLVTFTYDVKDDSGAPNDTSVPATVTILVKGTNDAPIIENVTGGLVYENAAQGVVVADVDASDPEGQVLTYSLVNDFGKFDINSTTGEVTVKDGASLDYETQNSYTLIVNVSDGFGGVTSQPVAVSVTDVTTELSEGQGETTPTILVSQNFNNHNNEGWIENFIDGERQRLGFFKNGEIIQENFELGSSHASENLKVTFNIRFEQSSGNWESSDKIKVTLNGQDHYLNTPNGDGTKSFTLYTTAQTSGDVDIKFDSQANYYKEVWALDNFKIAPLTGAPYIHHQFTNWDNEGWMDHVVTDNDSSRLGWFEGHNDSTRDFISREFDLGTANANETVNVKFKLLMYEHNGTWNSNDVVTITVNGQIVTKTGAQGDGTYNMDIPVTVDADGKVNIEIHSNTNSHKELWAIDDFKIIGTTESSADQVWTFDFVTDGMNIDVTSILSQASSLTTSDILNDSAAQVLKPTSLDEINLDDGAHILSNLRLEDVFSITDSDNTLKIVGDTQDKIDLDANWTVGTNNGTETEYTATYNDGVTNHTLKLLIENDVDVI